jgi:hypothetical protein
VKESATLAIPHARPAMDTLITNVIPVLVLLLLIVTQSVSIVTQAAATAQALVAMIVRAVLRGRVYQMESVLLAIALAKLAMVLVNLSAIPVKRASISQAQNVSNVTPPARHALVHPHPSAAHAQ